MSAGADLYQQLLGIGPTVPRPITIYSLLGTANFEANAELLLQRVEQQRHKLAGFSQPELQPAVTRLREMLTKAEQVVRSPELKARYDAKLRGTRVAPSPAVRPITPIPPMTPANRSSSAHFSTPSPTGPIPQPAPASPMGWPASLPDDNTAPQIQVTAAPVRHSAAGVPTKRLLVRNPLMWSVAGVGVAVVGGLAIWFWPREHEPTAKREKPTILSVVPAPPTPVTATPQPVPVTPPAVAPPPEPEPDPRRVAKILSTTATPSLYQIANEELQVRQTKAHDEYIVFGDEQWRDYDFEFETCIETSGTAICSLGFVIRCPDDNVLGSVESPWNTTPQIQLRLLERGKTDDNFLNNFGSRTETHFEPGEWQKFRVSVRGKKVSLRRNDNFVLEKTVDYLPHRGKVGFHVGSKGDFVTRFRNITVRDATGRELWSGLPAPDRHYTAIQPRKQFAEPLARLDPAKTPRRELPEKLLVVYNFDGQSKEGWAEPAGIPDADRYWSVENGKLTNKAGLGRRDWPLRLKQPAFKNFVFKARLNLDSEAFHLFFRAPQFHPRQHEGVEFLLRREGTSGVFSYGTWKKDASTASAPQETFDLEVIAASDCFEAKLNGRTINLHRTRVGVPEQGSLWIGTQSSRNIVLIEQLQVALLPDDFERLEAPPPPEHERYVWKYDGGQFERQRDSSWIAVSDQGERVIYLEKMRNNFSLLLQSLDGKTRVRLLDAESELSTGPFGMAGDEKYYNLQHAGRFVGPSLRQIPPADPQLSADTARTNAVLSPAGDPGMEALLSALHKEQAVAKQQSQLLFQTYFQELNTLTDFSSKRDTSVERSRLRDMMELIRREAGLSKKPHYFVVAADFHQPNVQLLEGINQFQARLNHFYQEQLALLLAAGKHPQVERLRETQKSDPLAQPLEVMTVVYQATPFAEEHFFTCLSDFTIREFPEQQLIWEYAGPRLIVIKGSQERSEVRWQDQLKIGNDEARNPIFFSYGSNKSGKIYSIVPRGIRKR